MSEVMESFTQGEVMKTGTVRIAASAVLAAVLAACGGGGNSSLMSGTNSSSGTQFGSLPCQRRVF
jgi:hypothetical protein